MHARVLVVILFLSTSLCAMDTGGQKNNQRSSSCYDPFGVFTLLWNAAQLQAQEPFQPPSQEITDLLTKKRKRKRAKKERVMYEEGCLFFVFYNK